METNRVRICWAGSSVGTNARLARGREPKAPQSRGFKSPPVHNSRSARGGNGSLLFCMRFSGGFNGFLAQCGTADNATCYLGICVLLPATLTEHLPGNLLPLSLDVGPRQRNPEHLGYDSHGEVVGDQVDLAPILREVESEGEERPTWLR